MSILRKNLSSADRKAIDDYTAIVRSLDVKDAEIARLTDANKALTAELNGKLWHWQKRATTAEAKLAKVEAERERLALAICGGEDAPGYANAQTVETLEQVARDSNRDHNAAIDRVESLSAELAEARKMVRLTNDAIAEYIRYLDGGEMRGSYDGKPERNGLRKAHYAARSYLSRKGASHAE